MNTPNSPSQNPLDPLNRKIIGPLSERVPDLDLKIKAVLEDKLLTAEQKRAAILLIEKFTEEQLDILVKE